MVSLPEVLREAGSRRAGEVVLQAGAAPVIHTDAGAQPLGDPWSETELFDALVEVLGPDQQADLAVGQVVEFSLQANGVGWNLVTEPGDGGVTVRGRARRTRAAPFAARRGVAEPAAEEEAGVSLDLPALEPFQPEREAPPTPRRPRSTRFDIGVDYGPPGDTPAPAPAPASSPPRLAASPLMRPPSRPHGTLAMPTPLPPTTATTTREFPSRLEPVDAVSPTMEVAVALPELFSSRKLGTGEASATGGLTELLRGLSPATLCFVGDATAAEDLEKSVPGVAETIDETTLEAVLALGLAEIPDDTWWVVRLEDPSRALGFVLRRLEEGAKVLVATRARTPAGAQRTLLGPDATTLTATWLAAQTQRMLVREGPGWSIHDLAD